MYDGFEEGNWLKLLMFVKRRASGKAEMEGRRLPEVEPGPLPSGLLPCGSWALLRHRIGFRSNPVTDSLHRF